MLAEAKYLLIYIDRGKSVGTGWDTLTSLKPEGPMVRLSLEVGVWHN
jgi:hypothetical protein